MHTTQYQKEINTFTLQLYCSLEDSRCAPDCRWAFPPRHNRMCFCPENRVTLHVARMINLPCHPWLFAQSTHHSDARFNALRFSLTVNPDKFHAADRMCHPGRWVCCFLIFWRGTAFLFTTKGTRASLFSLLFLRHILPLYIYSVGRRHRM